MLSSNSFTFSSCITTYHFVRMSGTWSPEEKRSKYVDDAGGSKTKRGKPWKVHLRYAEPREEEEPTEIICVMRNMMVAPNRDGAPVNYVKASEETSREARETNWFAAEKQVVDTRFWSHFHADWYMCAYKSKKNPTIAMKYID